MKHYLALACVAALSACAVPIPVSAPVAEPAPIEEPAPVVNPQSAKERFVAAVEANGCLMTAGNVTTIMSQATVGVGDLETIIVALQSEGRATADGANIRVITETCPA
ncbi:hypothetical protein [Yoonia sp. BS5-3]|uniref:Uncharacterized protein n=1 Tax=Yoonia phaeophyticola TaxID=3137369 RepID=A0ABZ2V5R2_9RHOB